MSTKNDPELWCRSQGHNWKRSTRKPKRRPSWGVRLSVECPNCGTVRHDIINTWGRVGARWYVYPEQYVEIREEIDAEQVAAGDVPGNTPAAAARPALIRGTPTGQRPRDFRPYGVAAPSGTLKGRHPPTRR